MPRLNLRAVPTAVLDPQEDEFRDTAREAGFAMQHDSLARRSGLPHLKIYSYGNRQRVVASFKRGREGLAWLAEQGERA